MAITPAMKVYRPRNMLELMQAVEYTFGIFYKKMFDNLSAVNVLPGPFSLYRREVFDKIGLFKHAHNTEDMEIAFRMHANGLKIVNAHNRFCIHHLVPSKRLCPWLNSAPAGRRAFCRTHAITHTWYLTRALATLACSCSLLASWRCSLRRALH